MPQNSPLPGIIGGAGPAATAQLYLDIMVRCQAAGLPRRPGVLVASLDIDLAVEDHLLHSGEGIQHFEDWLHTAARQLVAGGADFLALPCNTLHVLVPGLREVVPVPVLSILDATVEQLQAMGARRVGLLATEVTVASGLYQEAFTTCGMTAITPSPAFQAELQDRILAEVAQHDQEDAPAFHAAIGSYFRAEAVDAIVAGCTELKALLAGWNDPLPVIDSLDALGAEIVRRLLDAERTPS